MLKYSIKTNILIIFLMLMSLISILILSSQYYFSKQLAVNSTQKTFKHLVKNTSTRLNKASNTIKIILEENIDNPNLQLPISFKQENQPLHDLTQLMNIHQDVYSMYFTHKNGDFYEVINMRSSSELFSLLKAPQNTRWTSIISIKNKKQYSYFDKKSKLISKYTINKIYSPLSTVWYKKAIKASGVTNTRAYSFENIHAIGVTFAIELTKKGSVFAIDYTMQNLSKLLESQKSDKNLNLFIFDQKGVILASSLAHQKMVHKGIMEQFNEENLGKIIKYEQDSKNYFAIFKHLKSKDSYLGICLNTQNLYQPFIDNIEYSFSLSLLFLLLSIPIIFYATTVIVRPIKSLIKENNKIKNREFEKVQNIKTNIIEFTELSNSLVSMSSNIQEYQKSQEELLDSIVKLIAEAIDTKSRYTGGHCRRVPEIAQMLINVVSRSNDEIFKDFKLNSEDELKEFKIGAWLHDCGKVTTPEYVIDKSTKLETINDRIHEIRTRFEVLWRDAQISYLTSQLNGNNKDEALKALHVEQEKLIEDFAFIAHVNIGGEFMDESKQERIKEIANQEWVRNFDDKLGLGEVEILRYDDEDTQTLPITEKLLSDKKQHIIKREHFDYESYKKDGFKEDVPEYLYNYGEIYNLCIAKGTLTPEERYKINEHVIMSIKMLEKIPFPSRLSRVPEYAGTHHETLIGNGYPRQLSAKELSIPARVMAIADIFEALTASDRPYKKAKTLSESIKIMSFMVKDKHIDKDLFKLFLTSNLHVEYAKKHLKPEQIDEVNLEQYL